VIDVTEPLWAIGGVLWMMNASQCAGSVCAPSTHAGVILRRLRRVGLGPFGLMIQKEIGRWRPVVLKAGIRAD